MAANNGEEASPIGNGGRTTGGTYGTGLPAPVSSIPMTCKVI